MRLAFHLLLSTTTSSVYQNERKSCNPVMQCLSYFFSILSTRYVSRFSA